MYYGASGTSTPHEKKLETTGYGVTVYGTTQTQQLNVVGVSTFNDDVTFVGAAGTDATWDKDRNALNLDVK